MNRQIKFRAWDKTYILMNYKVQVGNTDYADQNYTCNSIWVDYGDSKSIGWMNADDKCIDLMQFTGLKDKFGKEIYEGDILEFKNDLGRHHKYTVFSVDGGLAINTHKSDFGKETQFYDACADMQTAQWIKQCTVIGNIYENADLLSELS